MQGVTYNTYTLTKQRIMTSPELPSEFEVVVVGTGLEQSIVAAAAARQGHTVLHVDGNDYYGDDWAAFNFNGLQEWIQQQQKDDSRDEEISLAERLQKIELKEGEKILPLNTQPMFHGFKTQWHVEEEEQPEQEEQKDQEERKEQKDQEPTMEEEEQIEQALEKDQEQREQEEQKEQEPKNQEEKEEQKEQEEQEDQKEQKEQKEPDEQDNSNKKKERRWTREKVAENSRKFNLDLTSRLLFARGSMVDLLIQSNISRYTEFKSVSRVLTVKSGKLEHVPSSRADVFATKHVSVVEKRILMKFITFCVEFDAEKSDAADEKFRQRTFLDFLKHEHKLTTNLIDFIMNSIAMVGRDAGCLEGLKATRKFLTSIGRFGNTPFLWSMYGCGELPQAFCRLCAVFGGTYFLGKSVDGVVVDDVTAKAVIFNGQKIAFKHLVLDSRKAPEFLLKNAEGNSGKRRELRRKICLLEDSILPSEKEQLTFVSLPPDDSAGSFTFVQEVGFGTAACPKGMYVMHLTSEAETTDENDEIDESRVLTEPSRLLWSASFKSRMAEENLPKAKNVHFTSGPKFELDYDAAIRNARDIYRAMFGQDEEFLPRAPDPEEIVIGGNGDGNGDGNGEGADAAAAAVDGDFALESADKKSDESGTKPADDHKETAGDSGQTAADETTKTADSTSDKSSDSQAVAQAKEEDA